MVLVMELVIRRKLHCLCCNHKGRWFLGWDWGQSQTEWTLRIGIFRIGWKYFVFLRFGQPLHKKSQGCDKTSFYNCRNSNWKRFLGQIWKRRSIWISNRDLCWQKWQKFVTGNNAIRKIEFLNNTTNINSTKQTKRATSVTIEQIIVSTFFGKNRNKDGIIDGNQATATVNCPHSILFDRISNCLIFTQQNAIRQIKLSVGKNFLKWKLSKIFLIYRILLRQCENSTLKRLLLQLISIQILQISASNQANSHNNNQQLQISNVTIQKQKQIIDYIKSVSNSKTILFDILHLKQ